MMKSSRLPFFLALSAGLTLSASLAVAQLNIEEGAPEMKLVLEETELLSHPLEQHAAVIIPEPGTYGAIGAAGLGLLLIVRRIIHRTSALTV